LLDLIFFVLLTLDSPLCPQIFDKIAHFLAQKLTKLDKTLTLCEGK